MQKLLKFIFISIILIAIIVCFSFFIKDKFLKKHTTVSDNINNSKITPYMEEKIDNNNNIIYCSTFQLTWNELKDNIFHGNILLQGNPESAEFLNKSLSTKNDISSSYYVAMSGLKKDNIVENINKALKEKFKEAAPTVTANLTYPNDILSYAYISVNLEFKYKFNELNNKINFAGKNVTAFGINPYNDDKTDKNLGSEVSILSYKNDNDFTISLSSKNSSDEIILAKVSPKDTLLNTILYVNNDINNSKTEDLNKGDKLEIPNISFDYSKDFFDLENKKILNSNFDNYKITKAMQKIKFSLDNSGAKLTSSAQTEIGSSAISINHNTPKNLVFDKPFLLMLKQPGKTYPYLAVWVNNSEFLSKDNNK